MDPVTERIGSEVLKLFDVFGTFFLGLVKGHGQGFIIIIIIMAIGMVFFSDIPLYNLYLEKDLCPSWDGICSHVLRRRLGFQFCSFCFFFFFFITLVCM